LEKATELATNLKREQFAFFKEVYEWLTDNDHLSDQEEALAKASALATAIDRTHFSEMQEAFDWLYDGGDGPKGGDVEEAIDAAVELARAHDSASLKKLREAYAWAHDEMGLDEDESLKYAKKKASSN
jgi:hypothetical protein